MRKHSICLTDPVSDMIEAQVQSGRYKDFSAALQDAAWGFFFGTPTPFDEYGVSPAEVKRSAERELAAIRNDRKAGKLKVWKPGQ